MNKRDKASQKHRSDSKLAVEKFFRRFRRKYKTEGDCLETLLRWINLEQSQTCKACGGHEIERKYGSREAKCIQCKQRIRITADSVFCRARTLRPWLAAILMMDENIAFNASDLSRGCDIVKSSGWTVVKKLSMVINEYFASHPDASGVFSAAFSDVFTRRSLLTPANEHPRSEQIKFEQSADEHGETNSGDSEYGQECAPGSSKENFPEQTKGTNERVFSERESQVLEILAKGPCLQEDLISAINSSAGELWSVLLILEIEQLIESLPGGRFRLRPADGAQNKSSSGAENNPLTNGSEEISDRCMSTIVAATEHLKREFGGISRKYLQLYLAAYWCLEDKNKWRTVAIVKACNDSRAISSEEIRSFDSPLFVAIAA